MAGEHGSSGSTPIPPPVADHPAEQATIAPGTVTPSQPTAKAGAADLPPSRYQPIQFHAAGNLGEVLLAQDPELNRSVALKRIQERHADNPESRRRFLREAEITGRLEHPGVVPVYGLGQDPDGHPCYAMRFIQGESLKDAIERFHAEEKPGRDPGERRLSLRQLLTSFVAVCKTMAYAHSRGVLHRDLKPANIMLGKYGETLVVDWGIAKTFERDEMARSLGEALLQPGLDGGGETQVGVILGTPAYSSPEQAVGHWDVVGPASDIFSLGATLYNLLTNCLPYQGSGVKEIVAQASMGEVIPPRQRKKDVQRALEAICLKAMAKERGERYATALDLAKEVEHWLADEPVVAHCESLFERLGRVRRRHQAAVVAGGALVLAALAVAASLVLAHARTIAETERTIAQQERTKAEGERELAQAARDQEKNAREAADRSRQEVEEQRNNLRVVNGVKLLDQGDGYGGLLWFTQALAAEKRGSEYAALHRERVAGLLRQCPQLTEVWRHKGPVTYAEFSPDGSRVVTTDGTARVWDAATGQPVSPPLEHRGPVKHVEHAAFSPDGRRVVTASFDRTARVWDAATGQPVTPPLKHDGVVLYAAFSPDGRCVVTASQDQTARVWDGATGQPATPPLKHHGVVLYAAFSPDSRRVVTASQDQTARVWDAMTGKPVTPPLNHKGSVKSASFNPDGRRVVTASLDQTAQVWDAATGQPVTPPLEHKGFVELAAFSPDGHRVVTASFDGTARVWDAATGQPVTPPLNHNDMMSHASFSPDGRCVVTASLDHTARVWDAATGHPLTPPLKHHGVVRHAAFSPDGRRIVTASRDQTARVWHVGTGQPVTPPMKHSILWPDFNPNDYRVLHVVYAAFSPDCRRAVTIGPDHTARVWDTATGQPATPPLKHHGQVLHAGCFSPDGRRIVSAWGDQTVRVWDAATGQPVMPPFQHSSGVNFAAFSPDGRRIVTASLDQTVRVWDSATGQPVVPPMKHNEPVRHANFSLDSSRVVTTTDTVAQVWDSATGKPVAPPVRHHGNLMNAAFSPDGRRVVTASADETARVWDAATGQPVTPPLKHNGEVWHAEFSPDGRQVVTASRDQTARVWDASTGQPTTPSLKHIGVVEHAAFSPDGRRVVTASWDQTARVWDAATGQPVTPPLKHHADVMRAAFSPDGRRLLTESRDRSARVWDLPLDERPTDDLVRLAEMLAGYRLDEQGGIVPLNWDSWNEGWDTLHARYASHFTSTLEEVRAWHREEAITCAAAGLWLGVIQHLDALLANGPANPEFGLRRGHALAVLAHWAEAAADFEQAMKGEVNLQLAGWHAACLAAAGNWEAHRKACTELLEHFGKNPDQANEIAWCCARFREGPSDLAQPLKLAEQAAALQPKSHPVLNTLGAVLVRTGHYADAIGKFQEGIKIEKHEGTAWDWLFLALANHKLGHADEARKWLTRAQQWIDQAPKEGANALPWDQRLELRLLRAEAEEAISKKP
jgi:WD40 repeat protein/tRNA A-37 threonylcarbamoyl transferase component Bud32/tetratricopeptide (TPR) repeat protein